MAIMSEINSSKDRKSGVKKKDKDPERSSKFENSPQGKAALRSGFGWCEEAGQVLGDVNGLTARLLSRLWLFLSSALLTGELLLQVLQSTVALARL